MAILYVSTKNAHKLKEISDIFSASDYEIKSFPNMPEIEETGTTFEENASIKAKELSLLTDSFVIADDSGLCVDALDGAPGIYSARYAGNGGDEANNRKLLETMKGISERSCRFVCVIALAQKGKIISVFRGEVEGSLAYEPYGAGGFGYDPIFILPDGRHMAELSACEKNSISHRKKALEKLRNFFSDWTNSL